MRPLAFVDCETTGLDPAVHEIIELAVVWVDPATWEVQGELALLVRPERIGDADPDALQLNRYNPEAWESATSLQDAMAQIEPLLKGAQLAGHNVGFDRGFLERAWAQVGSRPVDLSHHLLDTATLAWPLFAADVIGSLSLSVVCEHLGVDRGEPHWALDDARASLGVARMLVPVLEDHAQRADLEDVRLALSHRLGERVGSRSGPATARERLDQALLQVVDSVQRCAHELLRLDDAPPAAGMRTRRVYVCHPYRNDPEENAARVAEICRSLLQRGYFPMAPQLYVPQFVEEDEDVERVLGLCLDLMNGCDELWVYGKRITPGMQMEIDRAEARRLPVRFVDAETV